MAILQQYNSFFFYLTSAYVSHYKAIYYTFILTGTVLATSCLRLDMTCTAKNITKNDDVEINELRHTANFHMHVALLKVSIMSILLDMDSIFIFPLNHPSLLLIYRYSILCVSAKFGVEV